MPLVFLLSAIQDWGFHSSYARVSAMGSLWTCWCQTNYMNTANGSLGGFSIGAIWVGPGGAQCFGFPVIVYWLINFN